MSSLNISLFLVRDKFENFSGFAICNKNVNADLKDFKIHIVEIKAITELDDTFKGKTDVDISTDGCLELYPS